MKKIVSICKGMTNQDIEDNELEVEILNTKKQERKFFLKSLSDFSKNIGKESVIIKLKKIPKVHSDIDVLVKNKNMKSQNDSLIKSGYKLEGIQYGKDYGFRFKNRPTIIEIHDGLSYLGIDYVDENEVISRKKNEVISKIKIPYCSPEDDFLIFAAHSLFQNNPTQNYKGRSTFNLSDLYQFYYDSNQKDFDWEYLLKISKKYNWEEGLYYAIRVSRITFESKSLSKGENIFSNNISNKIRENIDRTLDNKIKKFPYIINPKILFSICVKKSIKDKSVLELIKYTKWFAYNKAGVILKKRVLG